VVEETIERVVAVEIDWVVERAELPPEPGMVISVVWVVDRLVVAPVVFGAPV